LWGKTSNFLNQTDAVLSKTNALLSQTNTVAASNLLAQTDSLLSQTNTLLSGTNLLSTSTTNAYSAGNFMALSVSNSPLNSIAVDLTNQVSKVETSSPTNSTAKCGVESTIQSLTGGDDASALKSAYSLTRGAKLTDDQTSNARQFANLTSAYVVQKNFSTLDGSQTDVTNLVTALRNNNTVAAITPMKNIASNSKLTDQQKQLIATVVDQYAPGYQKARKAYDTFKKLPGFGN
jgi:hypothetical protein